MYYDPATITLLSEALEAAWASLSVEQRANTTRVALAERILRLAAKGERDPIRLRTGAVVELVKPRAEVPVAAG